MKKIFTMLFAVSAVMLLAGCKFDEPTMPKADVGLPQLAEYWVGYICADDFYIEMTYDNRDEDEPVVLFHITDETVDAGINPGVMSLIPSASGAKYTDGIYVWWTKGNEAFLADSSDSENMILSDCVEVVESATVFGDLNGDDAEDVAMLLIGNSGGSDAFTYLGVRIAEEYERYDRVSTRLGDGVQVRSMKIERGEVVVELVTQGPNEEPCCGTLKVRKSFALQDGELVEVSSEDLGNVSPDEAGGAEAEEAEEADESLSDVIAPEDIDRVVAEQMVEIEKAVIQIGDELFEPEAIAPDMEDDALIIIYNSGANALYFPIDVANMDVSPLGDIVVLEEGGEDGDNYHPIFMLSEYETSEDGASIVVNGVAESTDGNDEMPVSFVYSEAAAGAGSTQIMVDGSEAILDGTLGTRTYAQLKEILEAYPEVDTLVLTQSDGSVNDAVNMHTGRLVRHAGLTTKVLADSDIASGAVDLFAAGIERIYTEGAIVGVHSWCCVGEQTAGELSKENPAHQGQLDYFSEMLGPELGPDFYFYTLESAPFDGIYEMPVEEIEKFTLATEIVTVK